MALRTPEILQHLAHHDEKFTELYINAHNGSHSSLHALLTGLNTYPNSIQRILIFVHLSNHFGIQLAQFVAISTTIEVIYSPANFFNIEFYHVLSKALYVNTSLSRLIISNNMSIHKPRVDRMLINALRLNPTRPNESIWELYNSTLNSFSLLKFVADQSTSPSMLEFLLRIHLN